MTNMELHLAENIYARMVENMGRTDADKALEMVALFSLKAARAFYKVKGKK